MSLFSREDDPDPQPWCQCRSKRVAILLDQLKDAGETGIASDLTIICRDKKYLKHKMMLSMWSRPLAANFIGGFKESFGNTLNLSDDDPALVGRMLNYFYKLDYDEEWHEGEERWGDDYEEKKETVAAAVKLPCGPSDAGAEEAPVPKAALAPAVGEAEPGKLGSERLGPEEKSVADDGLDDEEAITDDDEPEIESSITEPCSRPVSPEPDISPACLLLHSRMYMIADKYDIPSLCELALTRFKVACSRHWSSLDFCECIHDIYSRAKESNTPLREAVVKSAHKYIFRLHKKDSFLELLAGEKEFLFDVFLRHIQKTKKLWEDITSEDGDEP